MATTGGVATEGHHRELAADGRRQRSEGHGERGERRPRHRQRGKAPPGGQGRGGESQESVTPTTQQDQEHESERGDARDVADDAIIGQELVAVGGHGRQPGDGHGGPEGQRRQLATDRRDQLRLVLQAS